MGEFAEVFGFVLRYGGWPVVGWGAWELLKADGRLALGRELRKANAYAERVEVALAKWQQIGQSAVEALQQSKSGHT